MITETHNTLNQLFTPLQNAGNISKVSQSTILRQGLLAQLPAINLH